MVNRLAQLGSPPYHAILEDIEQRDARRGRYALGLIAATAAEDEEEEEARRAREAQGLPAKVVFADLGGAALVGTRLVGANLRECRLQQSWLDGANLTEADLRGAVRDWD